MVEDLVQLLEVEGAQLLREFKAIHQAFGNIEQPFAVLELPSVRNKFPRASRRELVNFLAGPLETFNTTKKKTLRLYPGVEKTLKELQRRGVVIVGHTEATVDNSYDRLVTLDIAKYMRHLYTLEENFQTHPKINRECEMSPPKDFVSLIPPSERKPNPDLLRDICATEEVRLEDAFYVGDSITRDISMARKAGVKAIWARYGRNYCPEDWDFLVQITNWTDSDVAREQYLKAAFANVKPDYIIDEYPELLGLV